MLDPKKDSLPEQEPGGEMREPMEAPEGPSGAGSRRVLLLLLLLVVVAGGGFYLRFGAAEPEPPPQPRQGVVTQPITMPIPVPAPPPAVERSEETLAEPETVASTQKPVEAASGPSVTSASPEPEAKVASAPVKTPKPAFALQTAPLTSAGQLNEAQRTLRTLGYEPSRASAPQTVTLTRLLLGVYPSAESMPRLREAQAHTPDAFPLRQGDKVAIYAGSFRDLDRARLYADVLYEKGIAVEEQKAQVVLDASVLVFGAFATEDDAAKALEAVRSAGLECRPVALP